MAQKEGLRERKRRETFERIKDTAIRLFLTHGYEETTLDAIVEAADVSRRSLFHYFSSKEDIVFANQETFLSAVVEEMRQQPHGRSWPALIEAAMVRAISDAATPDNIAIDRLVRNTPSLQPRNHLKYARMEEAITGVLIERSGPNGKGNKQARLLAAIFVSALRISTQEPSANKIDSSISVQQRLSAQFIALWKALRTFGEEGLAYHLKNENRTI